MRHSLQAKKKNYMYVKMCILFACLQIFISGKWIFFNKMSVVLHNESMWSLRHLSDHGSLQIVKLSYRLYNFIQGLISYP